MSPFDPSRFAGKAIPEKLVRLSSVDDNIAAEKGRLMAAQNLARDPEQRKRFEETFGLAYAKHRYPEVYAPSTFMRRIVDKIHFRGW
jgi:hypothetical protein